MVVGLVAARSEAGRAFIAYQAALAVNGVLAEGWSLDTPQLDWSVDGRLHLDNIVLRAPDGHVVLGIRHVATQLALPWPPVPEVRLETLRVDGVDVHLTSDADGVLDLIHAFGGPSDPDPTAAPFEGLPVGIFIDDLGLRDARVQLDGPDGTSLALSGLDLRAAVSMERNHPAVALDGVALSGMILRPEALPLRLGGDVLWTGDGLGFDQGLDLTLGQSQVNLKGWLTELSDGGILDVALEAKPIDLDLVRALVDVNMGGVYEGTVYGRGPLGGLALWGELQGVRGSRGHLKLEQGSYLCLPTADGRHHEVCRGQDFERPPSGESAPLAWSAKFDADQVALEQVFPAITGSIIIDGKLQGRGYGTGWPEGMTIEDVQWRGGKEIDVYGLRIRSVDGDLGIHDGVLHISDADLEAVAGRAQGGGTLDFRNGELDLDLSGPLQPEMLVDVGMADVGGRGRYTAKVTGNIYEDGVPIDVRGRLKMEPFTFTDDVRFGWLDGSFAATVKDGITHVGADVVAGEGYAWGANVDRVAVPDLQVDYNAGNLLVTGTAATPKLTYTESATFYDVSAPFRWDQRAGNVDPVLDADVSVGAQEIAGLMGNNGAAVVRLEGSELDADVFLRWDEMPFIVAPDISLDLDTLYLEIPELLVAPSYRQRWVANRPVRLFLGDGGVRDATVDLSSAYGRVQILGTVGTTGELDGRVLTEDFDLDVLAELFPDSLSGLDGDMNLTLALSGPASNAQLDGAVDVTELFIPGGVRWADLDGTFGVDDGALELELSLGSLGEPILRFLGTVPVVPDLARFGPDSSGSADARVVVVPGTLGRFSQIVPDLDLPEGSVSGVLMVSGNVLDPDLDLRGVTLLDVEGLGEPARVEFDIARRDGTLTTAVDGYEGLSRIAVVDGEAATQLSEVTRMVLNGEEIPEDLLSMVVDDLDVWVRQMSVSMTTLLDLTGVDLAMDGSIGGGAHISGSPDRPRIDLDLDLVGNARKQPFDATVDLDATDEGYDVDVELGYSGDTWLSLVGHVPMLVDLSEPTENWGRGDWDLKVGGTGVPLTVAGAVVEGLTPYTGRLSARGEITGPWEAPKPVLDVSAVGVRAMYRPLGIEFQDGKLRAEVRAGEGEGIPWGVKVRELSATTRPISRGADLENLARLDRSAIDVTADLAFDGGTLLDVTGEVGLDRTWLSASDGAQLRAGTGDTPLQVSGVWPELLIQGDLAVDRGDLEFNTANLFAERASLLNRSITVHRGAAMLEAQTVVEESILDTMVVDVDVEFGRSTQMRLLVPVFDDLGALGAAVTRADIEARLGGELDVLMDRGDISIGGEVRLLSGRLNLLNSRFDLEDSQITFLGSDYDDPRLDIRGVMSVSGGEVIVRVTNTAQDPRLELSSPDFGDAAEDLLAILVTGQSPEDFTAERGSAAIEVVSGLLVQSVLGGGQLGQIEVAGDGTVTIGLPVARNVQVWATADPVPGLNENQFTVRGEISLPPRFVIDGSWGDRESGLSLFWETRFDHIFPKRRADVDPPETDESEDQPLPPEDEGSEEVARESEVARETPDEEDPPEL